MRRSLAVCITLAAASTSLAQMLPPMPTSQPAAATQPTTNPAAVAAVKDALTAYNKAVEAADVKTLVDSVYVSTDLQKQALTLMGKLTTSGRGLFDASVAAYGAAELAKDNVTKQSFPAGYPQLSAEGMNVKVEGEKATLSSQQPDGPPALSMIEKGGAWKIDGDTLLPSMNAKQLADQSSIITAAIAAIEDVTTDVKAGKFRGGDEAIVVMNLRVQKGVRAAQAKIAPMPEPTSGPAMNPSMGPPPAQPPAPPQMP